MTNFPYNVPYTESLRFAMSIHADATSPGRHAPTIQNRKVPIRQTNAAYRSRDDLADKEVETLMESAASVGRHGTPDAALILVAYRHALRVSELVSLRWDQVDLRQGLLHVTRRKHGIASVHPLRGPELRALRRLLRDYPETAYVFVSERKAPLTADAVRKIVGRAGREAGIEFPVHPHMLRHATGYKLANDRQDTRAIQHYLTFTWATATSSTPPAIPNSRRIGSRTSGEIDAPGRARRKFRRLGLTPPFSATSCDVANPLTIGEPRYNIHTDGSVMALRWLTA
jgi:type 1 fimbriae regulatory protein FimE